MEWSKIILLMQEKLVLKMVKPVRNWMTPVIILVPGLPVIGKWLLIWTLVGLPVILVGGSLIVKEKVTIVKATIVRLR